MFKDEKGKILYVGKAKNLKKRVNSYFSKKALDEKTMRLISEVKSLDSIKVLSEIEAFLLEAELIKKHKPFYNIKLTDDKSYPLIEITKNNNPSVTITRKKRDSTSKYYGPYSDAMALRAVLKLVRKIFPYQSVKNHQKGKCLYYHLGLCPCVLAVPENMRYYIASIRSIEDFLAGKKNKVVKNLEKERNSYSKKEMFEEARSAQDKIDRILQITSGSFDPFHYMKQPNFYHARIEKELKALLGLLKPYFPELKNLRRIECYDISNISGKNATGSMVVFVDGEKTTSEYRRFKIRSKDTPDDFLMMQEVLSRRLTNTNWDEPSLIVIDGGKGQVSATLKAMASKRKRIPLIGLAKKEEIIVVPLKTGNLLEFSEIKLPQSNPGINLLKTIRDEAHRFAITYHRLLRKKKFLT